MWLAKEAEKAGILAMAMRLGSEKTSRFPVQPVHLVPPGMRFPNAVAAEPCGSPIDVGSSAQDILWDVILARQNAHATDK